MHSYNWIYDTRKIKIGLIFLSTLNWYIQYLHKYAYEILLYHRQMLIRTILNFKYYCIHEIKTSSTTKFLKLYIYVLCAVSIINLYEFTTLNSTWTRWNWKLLSIAILMNNNTHVSFIESLSVYRTYYLLFELGTYTFMSISIIYNKKHFYM